MPKAAKTSGTNFLKYSSNSSFYTSIKLSLLAPPLIEPAKPISLLFSHINSLYG
jgi:hypothetical protein